MLTQIGHTPVWVEAQGQIAVQCGQNEILQKLKNSNRAVLTQIGHEPGRLEAQGQTSVQCRQNENFQQQNSSRAVSNQIGYAPVRLEVTTTESREVRVSDTSHITRPTEIQNRLALAIQQQTD